MVIHYIKQFIYITGDVIPLHLYIQVKGNKRKQLSFFLLVLFKILLLKTVCSANRYAKKKNKIKKNNKKIQLVIHLFNGRILEDALYG